MKKFILLSINLLGYTSWAQQTPEALAVLWVGAIKEHSVKKLDPLIHPNCPKNSILPNILERMVDGGLPSRYTIEANELGPREHLEKVYLVIPEKQLNIKFITQSDEEKKRYGLGKGFPIARYSDRWYFVICTKVTK